MEENKEKTHEEIKENPKEALKEEIKTEEAPKENPKEEIKIKEAPAEVKKETAPEKQEQKPEQNLLEFGEYRMFGPKNGDISIEKIELKSVTGSNRIWKIKSLDQKQIILEVIKFG